jgi:hypothetical protein
MRSSGLPGSGSWRQWAADGIQAAASQRIGRASGPIPQGKEVLARELYLV